MDMNRRQKGEVQDKYGQEIKRGGYIWIWIGGEGGRAKGEQDIYGYGYEVKEGVG